MEIIFLRNNPGYLEKAVCHFLHEWVGDELIHDKSEAIRERYLKKDVPTDAVKVANVAFYFVFCLFWRKFAN